MEKGDIIVTSGSLPPLAAATITRTVHVNTWRDWQGKYQSLKFEYAVMLFPTVSFVLIVTGKTITEIYWCLFLRLGRERGSYNYISVITPNCRKRKSNYKVHEHNSAAERFHSVKS